MTASKIHQEIRKIYPKVNIWSITVGTNTTWYVDTEIKSNTIGKGRTAKKAWVAAYEKVQKELKEKI